MNIERSKNQKNLYIIFITFSVLFISYLHYSTIPAIHELHNFFAELYYLPLVLAALVFGLKGALLTYICVSVLYIPHIIINWTGNLSFAMNKLFHALISAFFTFLAGYLVDREKRQREQSEKYRYLTGLGQAAAAIVHDLKNPLISILGYARRIQRGKGDLHRAIQTVIDAAEDMQDITHNVLDFAKPINLKQEAEDINNIINLACISCRPRAAQKGVTLSIELSDSSVKMLLDKSHMKRALVNLLNNAIDASGEGSTVQIGAVPESDHVILRIKDHGEGMDSETLENIFIPFYTRKSYGTGLGMAITKKIIEGHDGSMRIESHLMRGTEIIVVLPRKEDTIDRS